ncbi:hypothetical protein [Subtercola boreus]|uniref:hypothetical protein n=1 Tax=Subtercola boreus TaxID=120213 RepID=UPI003460228A
MLEPSESELAQQLIKDPYVFDFLGIDSDAGERQIEQAMVERISRTLANSAGISPSSVDRCISTWTAMTSSSICCSSTRISSAT